MPTKEEVLEALRRVMDPELHRDIVSLNMVRSVQVEGDRVRVHVVLTTPACPLKGAIRQSVEATVRALPGVADVEVQMGADVVSSRGRAVGAAGKVSREERLPGVRNIVAVGSGKGGVGKSTVAVNLAVALAQSGARAGLLDADLYGPSVPILLGATHESPEMSEEAGRAKMLPLERHGLKVFSIGFLLKDTDAVVWRGPLLHKAVQQFLDDVAWGELDYLVVDLPPGTGDIQISLSQLVPVSSAVVVTTPQDVAFADVLRAIRMFRVTKVPILGVIENMASFVCPTCGTEHSIFGDGHVEERCREHDVAYLGAIPMDLRVAPAGDQGRPIVVEAPDSPPARALAELAARVAARQSVLAHDMEE